MADVQLTTSIAYSLAALIMKHYDNISAYHYNIVCYLALAAAFTSTTSMFTNQTILSKPSHTAIRVILIMMALVLLCILLGPRWMHYLVFPGRPPQMKPNNSSNTALVIQASCLLSLDPFSDCKFSTDRRPLTVLSDVWATIPLGILISASVGFIFNFSGAEYYADSDASDDDDEYVSGVKRKHWATSNFILHLIGIAVSGIWVGYALWKCWVLQRWMNQSGWLADKKETTIASFGAIVPFFMMIGTFSLLAATASDGKLFSNTSQRIY
jgi:hypothetical protein